MAKRYEYGEATQFELAQGFIPRQHPDKAPKVDLEAIGAAADEKVAAVVGDMTPDREDFARFESQTDGQSTTTDADVMGRTHYLLGDNDKLKHFPALLAEKEAQDAAANPGFPQPDYSEPTQAQRDEFAAEAQAGEDEAGWDFPEENPYAYQPGDELPADSDVED